MSSGRANSDSFSVNIGVRTELSSRPCEKSTSQHSPQTNMNHTFLFASPKKGGLLQSSGLVDLPSLMRLSQTCKASAIDEQSLILLIENEVTRNHKCQTIEEAIAFWVSVCQKHSLLRLWLERDSSAELMTNTSVAQDMVREAVSYEVMFVKMLRNAPTSNRLEIVNNPRWDLLHLAACFGNIEGVKYVLSLYPESQRLEVMNARDSLERMCCIGLQNRKMLNRFSVSIQLRSAHWL